MNYFEFQGIRSGNAGDPVHTLYTLTFKTCDRDIIRYLDIHHLSTICPLLGYYVNGKVNGLIFLQLFTIVREIYQRTTGIFWIRYDPVDLRTGVGIHGITGQTSGNETQAR